MSYDVVIVLTGMLVAAACALLGTFLILRKMAMLSDAISHAILPGLVAGYVVAQGPNLLLGFAGAVAAALLTVWLVESLARTGKVGGESAIGIVFPAMFALGTVAVSRFFADVHLDADAILFGNIEFAPLDTLSIGGVVLGPQPLWVMGGLFVVNLLFVGLFYKELKLATFDAGLAATLGFAPAALHYALMAAVSLTSVGAFTAVGAVLTVALLIVPAATAYLLTDRLPVMLALAMLAGALSALLGYLVALALDVSVAGAMATVAGVLFATALLFSPGHGLLARARRVRRQQVQFAVETLLVHLFTHEQTADAATENAVGHLTADMRWSPAFVQRALAWADRQNLIERRGDLLLLTSHGRQRAQELAT